MTFRNGSPRMPYTLVTDETQPALLCRDLSSGICEHQQEPLCRHHHRCKQAEGWWLEQPEPGVLVWRTPSGRTCTTAPAVYPIIAAAALRVADLADPGGAGPNPHHSWAPPLLLLAYIAVVAALGILGHGVVTSWKLRRSRRRLSRRPGPGGHALEGERRASTGAGHDAGDRLTRYAR